ncbi:MAG: hypothetical protein ACRDX9_18270 [Acidimicrobiia bacterium]
MRYKAGTAFAVLGLALVSACGGSGAADGTIEITGLDYGFAGVPETAATGAELTFSNESEAEFHEMVVFRIADGEERPLPELLELPEEESESLIEFQGVLVALPGEDGFNPEADGTSVALGEAGRYAIVCFIPQGADPAAVEEAMANATDGPPDLGDGTPHAFLGMAAEFQVEE